MSLCRPAVLRGGLGGGIMPPETDQNTIARRPRDRQAGRSEIEL